MQTHFISEELPYTGRELRSHWIMEACVLEGDAIAAVLGPCDVALEHMVDLVYGAAGEALHARQMLHFIVERFDTDLEKMVLWQRLLVAIAAELLPTVVTRRGDDLFAHDRKLSVSIATASPVSTLIHFALNVDPTGAPVPAIGLDELGVDPRDFAQRLMAAFAKELAGVREARCKVRPVS